MTRKERLQSLPAVLIALSLTAYSASAAAETFYVDGADGDDSYDGRAETHEGGTRGPKRTWTWISYMDAPDFLSPGDRVLFRRGTTISRDDAENDFNISNVEEITFGAYGDASLPRPIIDGRGTASLFIGWNGGTHDLVFEDLTFATSVDRNHGALVTGCSAGPDGCAEGVTFRRCEFDATNQVGFEVSDETITFSSNNVTIEDCYVHGSGRNGVYVSGTNNIFQRNVVEGFRVGIKLNGDESHRPIRNVVRQNLLIDNDLVAIELAEADHSDIYANVVYIDRELRGDWAIGVQIEDDEPDGEPGGEYLNVFNNTIIMNGDHGPMRGMRSTKGDDDSVGIGNIFRNNLVYIYGGGSGHRFVVEQDGALLPTMDHNLYFAEPAAGWKRDGIDDPYTSLAEWMATPGGPDMASRVADPIFLVDPDGADPHTDRFAVAEGSPAINAGALVEMHTEFPYEDFLGNPYIGVPDIGAFEYGAPAMCEGELCVAGDTCVGGTFDGLCCVGGTCGGEDAGPGADAGPAFDGGPGFDGGPALDGGSLDGALPSDAGPADGGDEGCSCSVGARGRTPLGLLVLVGLVTWRLRRKAVLARRETA